MELDVLIFFGFFHQNNQISSLLKKKYQKKKSNLGAENLTKKLAMEPLESCFIESVKLLVHKCYLANAIHKILPDTCYLLKIEKCDLANIEKLH